MSRIRRVSNWQSIAAVDDGMRVAMVAVGLALATFCNAVFVGIPLLVANLGLAGAAAGAALIYASVDGRKTASVALRLGNLMLLTGVAAVALADFWFEIHAHDLRPAAAIKISLPFCVFMAVAGRRLFDWYVFLSVCGITYIAGIWITPQPPQFPLMFLGAALATAVYLALAFMRHDMQRFRRLSRDRLLMGLEPPKLRGRVPVGRSLIVLTGVTALMIGLAVVLFVTLPRPTDLIAFFDTSSSASRATESDLSAADDSADADSAAAAAGRNGGANSPMQVGFARAVELERVGEILVQKVPQYRVRFETMHGVGAYQRHQFYLRLVAFDEFDGKRWHVSSPMQRKWEVRATTPDDRDYSVRLPLGNTVLTEPEAPITRALARALNMQPGSTDPEFFTAIAEIEPLPDCRERGVPLPYLAMDVGLREIEYNPEMDAVMAPRGVPRWVWVRAVSLDLSRHHAMVANRPSDPVADGHYTLRPVNRSPRFPRLAADLLRSSEVLIGSAAVSDLDKVKVVQAFLSGPTPLNPRGFFYSLDRPVVPPGMTALEHFLFETRSGHCELYATAAAMLLREMGLSTRVVGGYLGGEFSTETNAYTVYSANAHLWLEVYFRGVGWFPFDPTPSTTRRQALESVMSGERTSTTPSAITATPTDPTTQSGPETGDTPPPADSADGVAAASDAEKLAGRDAIGGFSAADRERVWSDLAQQMAALGGWLTISAGESGDAASPLTSNFMWIVGALIMGGFAVVGGHWVRRWVSRKPAALTVDRRGVVEPAEAPVLSWYEQALVRLSRLGITRQPTQTPAEFAADVAHRFAGAGASFSALTTWFHATRYGHQPLSGADIQRLKAVWSDFLRALRERERAAREANSATQKWSVKAVPTTPAAPPQPPRPV